MKGQKVDLKNVFFIDAITSTASTRLEKDARVVYAANPTDLTGMGVAVGQQMRKIKGEKLLVIDALRTLLVYNNPRVIVQFVNSLAAMSSSLNFRILVLLPRAERDSLVADVAPFFDKIIAVGEK